MFGRHLVGAEVNDLGYKAPAARCHEKNANATSVAMMDAIAVANAEVHADFR